MGKFLTLKKGTPSPERVQLPYLVDAQRAPFRSRTKGFLGTDIFFSVLVRGRPFFLGTGKGGGATLYVKSSFTLQTGSVSPLAMTGVHEKPNPPFVFAFLSS